MDESKRAALPVRGVVGGQGGARWWARPGGPDGSAGTIRRAGVHGAEPGGCKYRIQLEEERRAGAAGAGQAGGDEGTQRRRFPPEERPPQVAYRLGASDGGQGPTNRASARGKGGGPWGVWGARPGGKPFPAKAAEARSGATI